MNQCVFNPLHCKNPGETNRSEVPKYNKNYKISIKMLNEIKGAALVLEEG